MTLPVLGREGEGRERHTDTQTDRQTLNDALLCDSVLYAKEEAMKNFCPNEI